MDDTPRQFAVPAQLDKVTVSLEHKREIAGQPWDFTVTGHSRKRRHPLWTYSERIEDKRNVESTVGWVLGSVAYYMPTSPDKFLRSCMGGEAEGPEDHGMIPML